jgi:hypothetical protein
MDRGFYNALIAAVDSQVNERNKKVPGRPGSWGPPWNLLVSPFSDFSKSLTFVPYSDPFSLEYYTLEICSLFHRFSHSL